MNKLYFDRPVGNVKVKRAEASLLRSRSNDLASLQTSELLEFAWAVSTLLTATQQGMRLAPEVFDLAESVAHSQSETSVECGRPFGVPRPGPAARRVFAESEAAVAFRRTAA